MNYDRGARSTFELKPVAPFRLDLTVWTLRRRSHNIVDHWDGTAYRRVLLLPAGPVKVEVTQPTPSEKARLRVTVTGQPVSAAVRGAVTTALERLLGLRINMAGFDQFAAHHQQLKPLANRFRGMRPPRFATVFESAVNAIACQQMTLTLGIHLLNRLTVAYGTPMGEGDETVHAFPRPIDLAGLIPAKLRQIGFSLQKGRAMIEVAQSIAEGHLDLESLANLSDDEAMMRLRELRGLGRWSAEYVLLRGLGRTHIFPGDDVGARNNLQRWLRLSKPLDYEGVQRVSSQWHRYAGLVYFHLLLDRLAEAGHISEIRLEAISAQEQHFVLKQSLQRTAEKARLDQANRGDQNWRRWGPYLSERQWGTVREDYSAQGDAWGYLSHDHARSRAYRWGEDGIAGICDDQSLLCLALALWNGRDPILKERLFGLTNREGNHGEDVKELYYYLDATPTHSYLKMLYKYPQEEFPYNRLVEENRRRGRDQPEYELLDTGIFDDDRYFDVFVEYAKASPDDLLMLVTAHNRGPQQASLHILPQLWFRNTWSWNKDSNKPSLKLTLDGAIEARNQSPVIRRLYAEHSPLALFSENETNVRRLFGLDAPGPFKDAFHEFIVRSDQSAVADEPIGTKAAFHQVFAIPGGSSRQMRLRLTTKEAAVPFGDFDQVFARRRREADEFYAELQADIADSDTRLVQRQALAGMIWSKQFYYYDIPQWLDGDSAQHAPPPVRKHGRNHDWLHLNNADVISVPDKWEFPWYAAWDLAFHCIPFAIIDAEFAKSQLVLLTREWYMNPNGQLPAYEWAFGDTNPPVHAWATWRVFQIDRKQRGDCGDLPFLERVLHKLMLNFTWWVNRKDAEGRNLFQGGFLGLDNIGVFDRNAPLPQGGFMNQADGTSWMAMYSINLMRIALELALYNPVYEDIATKFFEHFLNIAGALNNIGGEGLGLWDEQDEFYYDEMQMPDGRITKLKARSMVGLIPLFAVETLEPEMLKRLPGFNRRLKWFLKYRPELAKLVSRWQEPGSGERRLLSLLRGHRMKMLLKALLDETEFLSDFGVRALSRRYGKQPYTFNCNGQKLKVAYQPAESDSGLFGGNSNWRGPIWFPVNYLIIESLQKFHHYYGDDFKIECPTGSGQYLTINGVAQELSRRLERIFLRDAAGHRPVFGKHTKLQTDPHFRDYVLFHEYFHGDNGRGLGASHQTGWTGLVAKLLQPRYELTVSYPSQDGVDMTSEDSFPASDAPSWTVVTGTGPSHPPERDELDCRE